MINSEFMVICNKEQLYKGGLQDCIDYLHKIDVEQNTYYWVANFLEYNHKNNTEKFFNSYYTRYNDKYYDFIKESWNNHFSILDYMNKQEVKTDGFKKMTIFDFLGE